MLPLMTKISETNPDPDPEKKSDVDGSSRVRPNAGKQKNKVCKNDRLTPKTVIWIYYRVKD